jgi:uncharacterized protein
MADQVQILIQMQQFDDKITERNILMKDLPKELNGLRTALEETQIKSDEAAQELENNKKDQKLKELEISSNNEKAAKYKHQLLTIETNKEYKALNSEITHLEDKNSKIDDELIEMMEIEVQMKTTAEEAVKKHNKAQEELAANEKRLEDKIEAVKKETDEIRAERNTLATANLSTSLIKRYGSLIKTKNRKAIVFNSGNSCSGCGFHLRPQLVIEINTGEKIVNCESCGRMLVKHTE